jgi:hypothetical protein
MSIYSDLRDKLYDSLEAILPTTQIVQAYTNGPEPVSEYVVFDVTQVDQIGREYISTLTDFSGDQQIVSQYETKVLIEFVGKQNDGFIAADMINEFYFKIDTTPVQEEFLKNNLSYMKKGSIRRVPKKRETDWYMCFQVDVFFAYQVEARQSVDTIDTVELTSTFTNPDNSNPVVVTQIIQ